MIKRKYFQEETIRAKRNELKVADPGLFEKAIHAFELLGCLAESGLDFIFKGGTSLMLHIPEPQRLSIDIDILSGEKPDNLDSKLKSISMMYPFLRCYEDERGHRGLPNRRHFKFFYNSQISKREDSVLLDIVEENKCLLPIQEKVIKSTFFETDRNVKVKVPIPEGLLGDKLSAFAPNTLGVPFLTKSGHLHSLQVIKQMFDIGQLFDIVANYKEVFAAYLASYKQENEYKKGIYTLEQALDDSVETALEVCRMGLRGHKASDISGYLDDGIRKLQNHLISNPFRPNIEAKISASKAFALFKMIRGNSFDLMTEYGLYIQSEKQIELIRSNSIDSTIDRLKKTNPEAYYYLLLGILSSQ
ncbi:MAG TPA: hypothetical protein DD381_14060 [Lentisphaeria bacterium]|nr:MAG: hypothetical protein A2X47_01205 [Lentisphaerae bacterium GWF2_38_69]HBM17448.1 hypothetical protein [Lentisphaeria bacterium]